MKTISILVTYDVIGQIVGHPNYIITKCGKIINRKKGTVIKRTNRGYFLDGKFVKDYVIESAGVKCPF